MKKKKYSGLCTTCINDSTCKMPRAVSLPVESCEEYVCEKPTPADMHAHKYYAQKNEVELAKAAAQEMGLCSNCENRETCTFPNARKNVQHCEEYQ